MTLPGNTGLKPNDPAGTAADAKAAKPVNPGGITNNADKDRKVDVNNNVTQAEGNWWLNTSGSKQEVRIGGSIEFVLGMKHSVVAKVSTEIAKSNSWAKTTGSFTNEMLLAKYEILGQKTEIIKGDKAERFIGPRRSLTFKKFVKKNSTETMEEHALEKELNEIAAKKIGPALKRKSDTVKRTIHNLKEKVNALVVNGTDKLDIAARKSKSTVKEMTQTIKTITKKCGKFEQRTDQMKLAVGAVLAIEAKGINQRQQALSLKGDVLKMTAELIKLGE
jgi:hypothetical protein